MACSGFIRTPFPIRCYSFNHVPYHTALTPAPVPREAMFKVSRRMSSLRLLQKNYGLCANNDRKSSLSISMMRNRVRIFTIMRLLSDSSSGSLNSDTPPPPIKDDSHPSLYYHFFDAPNRISESVPAFALSFLEERPKSGASACVIGWLPALSRRMSESNEMKEDGGGEGEGESGLNDFVENYAFVEVLHDVLRKNVCEDEVWINGAMQLQNGWMHIFDQRNPPPLGRIPEPDDIIATILVENSIMVRDTYQPMPSYRLCTRDGVCLLSEKLLGEVKREVGRINTIADG